MLSQQAMDFVGDIERLTEPGQLVRRALREARVYGLDYVAANGTYDMANPEEGDILHAGLPADWTGYYLDNGYLSLDPALKQCRSATLPFQWREIISANDLSSAERQVMLEAREANLNNGLIVPIHGPDGYGGFVSYAGPGEEISREAVLNLQIVSIYLHDKLRTLVKRPALSVPLGTVLTPREAECLHWMALGKSDWEIGEILTISEHTVKKHADKIKNKLGVRTRVQAVVEALKRALIAP